MIETPSEKEARLQAVRAAGRSSYLANRGEFTDGGYARGTDEFNAWEAGWKQGHNVSYVHDTSRSTTSNWHPEGSCTTAGAALEPVNEYALLKGRKEPRR